MGPGTGRHEEQAAWYLPMRGRHASLGAACSRARRDADPICAPTPRRCAIRLGLALERALAGRDEQRAPRAGAGAELRNTLLGGDLARLSHAAGDDPRRRVVAATSRPSACRPNSGSGWPRSIVDEADAAARLTDNTLQLARLDPPGVALRCDWESVEEIVGTVLRPRASATPRAACERGSSPACR